MNAISKIEPTAAVVLFESEKFNAFYAKLKADIDAVPVDLTTDKGRKAIASAAAKVRTEKASIDRDRKRLTQEWRDMTAQVNGAWKSIETQLDELAVEARRPLTEWEEAEKVRVALCQCTIDAFKRAAVVTLEDTAATVRERGKEVWVQEIDPAQFGDMLDEAVAAKDTAVVALKSALARLTREEAERAELEKLRAEAAERERIEAERIAAEQAAQRAAEETQRLQDEAAAAEKAKADREAEIAAQAEQRAKDDAERAAQVERDRIQREHDEALAAERRRAEQAEREARAERDRAAKEEAGRQAEIDRQAREQAAREADRAHRGKIMAAAKEAIMEAAGIGEDAAKTIVLAIAGGNFPHVSLRF